MRGYVSFPVFVHKVMHRFCGQVFPLFYVPMTRPEKNFLRSAQHLHAVMRTPQNLRAIFPPYPEE